MERTASPAESPAPEPASLPEDVEKFLVAFARALQKHAMYPESHPALEPAARSVAGALERATGDRGELTLDVAPDRIGFGEASTDPDSDLFRSLARRLHRHHLSVVILEAGADEDEVDVLLEALAREADEENAAGLRFDGQLPGCPHIEVRPVPYAAMKLADDSEELRDKARSLWFELARAAHGMGREADDDEVPLDPDEVARAVAGSTGDDPEYAEAIVERLSEAARLFRGTRKQGEGEGALGTLSGQLGTLVTELPLETLVELLSEGSTPERARQILFDVSYQLEPDALERVLDAVADVRFVEISGWLGRIFGKLGSHARSGDADVRDEADEQMRAQIRDMVARWELENPNPTEYEGALSQLALDTRNEGTARMAAAEPARMVRMGLELDVGGDWIARAAAEVEEEGGLALVRDLVETPEEVSAAEDVWRGLLRPAWIRDFLAPPEPDPELARAVLARCGPERTATLLEVLSGAESRALRRAVFDRLVEMGDVVGPQVVKRLDREEWFVRRNLLAILNELDELPEEFSARPYLEEDQPEIRHEAISLALREPAARAEAIRTALADPHSRTVIQGLTAAREDCPGEAVPDVAGAAQDEDLPWSVRVHAIRALGAMDDVRARKTLIRLATRRAWPFFWKRRIRRSSRPVLASLRALQEGWSEDPEARQVLERARSSGDEDLRAAARGEADGEDR